MFFRFSAALLLIVLVSMAGVALEKRTLELRRAVSRQYYQTDLLIELHVRLRLKTQQLTAPSQLASLPAPSQPATSRRSANAGSATRSDRPSGPPPAEQRRAQTARLPLLRFQQPFSPEGID